MYIDEWRFLDGRLLRGIILILAKYRFSIVMIVMTFLKGFLSVMSVKTIQKLKSTETTNRDIVVSNRNGLQRSRILTADFSIPECFHHYKDSSGVHSVTVLERM